ncbi:MAG: PQQ-binding-like beta-propeller repeat protein [Phycisphaerales bacterium JB052]
MKTTGITIPIVALICSSAAAQREFDADHHVEQELVGIGSHWTHTGGNPKHNSVHASGTTPSLLKPVWINADHVPVAQTGLVVDEARVYTLTRDETNATYAVALDRQTGDEIWAVPVAPPVLDSWSSPTIDLGHGTLVVASGSGLVALDTQSGEERWSTELGAIVVNASPVVADDLGDRDRAFITTYSFGGGAPASLVCINTDAFDAAINPYQPGDIVWSLALGGDSSGNTAAYQNGRVYLATASDGSSQRGTVRCYDITGDTAPASPVWSFTNTINAGFFAGVTIAKGHIYASSYSFSGLQTSANTVKLNKNTGALVWSVPTNRTDTSPIVLPNGDVIVSGGVATGAFDFLPFFGSLPSIQYIDDQGQTATLAWDSALATHDDLNANGYWDFGEPFLSIGGWTHQPIALSIQGSPHLLVGTLPETQPGVNIDHNTDLRLIDLSRSPTELGFIVDHASGTGNTPAYASGWVFTGGEQGISAYAPPSPLLRMRELIDQYTRNELTLDELLERLPR